MKTNIVWCLSLEEKSTYSHINLVFVAKISDGKIFNGFADKSLKYKSHKLLEMQPGTCLELSSKTSISIRNLSLSWTIFNKWIDRGIKKLMVILQNAINSNRLLRMPECVTIYIWKNYTLRLPTVTPSGITRLWL